MTNDLLIRTLRGEETERRPLWIMRQAGRFLPEYRRLKEQHSFLELAGDPKLAADVTMLPFDRFDLDGAIIFADIMSPVAALDIGFRFDPGPVLDKPLRSAADIDRLREPEPETVAPEVIEALSIVRQRLDGRASLIGFAGAPLTLAAYLIQGHGKSTFPQLRALAASDPQAFSRLLGKLTKLVAGYLRRQAEAGAQAVQIFDSWGGLLPKEAWQRLVKPHLRELLEETALAGVPRILFLHDSTHVLDDADDLPWDALGVDWRLDLAAIRQRVGLDRPVQGNLDPAVLLAGPETTRAAAQELMRRVPARGHVVNLGHGIMPEAPLDSVAALVDAVRNEGKD